LNKISINESGCPLELLITLSIVNSMP
jgi:hypothetical protein